MIETIVQQGGSLCQGTDLSSEEATANELPTLVTVWRRDLVCEHANDACREWFGRPSNAIVGSHLRDVLGERVFAVYHPAIETVLGGREQRLGKASDRLEGAFGRATATCIPRLGAAGEVLGFVMQVRDRAPALDTRRRLSLASLVYDCMREGVIVADLDGVIVSVNPAFTALTGYTASEAIGRTAVSLGLDVTSDSGREAVRRELARTGAWRGDSWSRRRNGELFLAEQTVTLARGPDGREVHTVALFHDVTETRRDLHRLRQAARRDALTGLANRSALVERLDELTRVAERAHQPFAVLFVDLDGFKTVNDRYGHDAGDVVLQVVAMRLSTSVREGDLVARLAGDEFVVVIESRDVAVGTAEIASRIRRSIRRPMPVGHTTIAVSASVGQAMFPDDDTTTAGLIARADARMYRTKHRRR